MAKKRANGSGSVTKRKDGRWEALLTLPDGSRKRSLAPTRREAEAKLRESQERHEQGLPQLDERQTLGLFLAAWLEHSVKPRRRPSTYRGYEVNVRRHICPQLGALKLSKLSPQQIDVWLNTLRASGLKPRTVQYAHAVLRAALNQALRWNLVPRNVATLVEPVQVERARVRPLEPSEAQAILAAVRGHRFEALYTVALSLGLRISETLGLQWRDVDFVAEELHVRAQLQYAERRWQLVPIKTANGQRTIGLPASTAEALEAHRERQLELRRFQGPRWKGFGSDLVFTTDLGTPLSRHNVWRDFSKLLAQAALPHARLHDLRHACATVLLAQGEDLAVISELLGHSGIQITKDIYAHVGAVRRKAAAARMQAALTSAG